AFRDTPDAALVQRGAVGRLAERAPQREEPQKPVHGLRAALAEEGGEVVAVERARTAEEAEGDLAHVGGGARGLFGEGAPGHDESGRAQGDGVPLNDDALADRLAVDEGEVA